MGYAPCSASRRWNGNCYPAVAGTSFASLAADVEIASGAATETRVLNITAPTFNTVTKDYTQPTAQAIIINNSGNSQANISNVEVTPDTAFEVGGSGASVPAGGSINTWTIQPKADLEIGEYTAIITVTYDGTSSTTATTDVSFRVSNANQSIGIDYSHTDLIVPGSTDGFAINLTKEVLEIPENAETPYTIAAFSIDGGLKWKAVKSGMFSDANFPKLLNKDLTLHISNVPIDRQTKKPPETVVIVTFAKINKRPAAPKLAVNYAIGADLTGTTSGEWVLTERNGTTAVKNGIEIGVANAVRKAVDDNGYGVFFEGDKNGIPVKTLPSSNKVEKITYFIRTAPTAPTQAGQAYTAAGKSRKITASSEIKQLKAVKPKTDRNTQELTISLKKGLAYTVNDESVISTGNVKVTVSVEKGDSVTIWNIATAKKPASKKFMFDIS